DLFQVIKEKLKELTGGVIEGIQGV
uniref:Citropin-3.1.2 n=1 Tax=Ranoidea citropa TaxID=94770 RepID=CT31_RANCI|nr:RecName: Full=Citropin-3.1.2; Contains: RecName: Full=Citropin-3.1.1; Contains: RecName: Full=Citropin-3.1 [Ranoidea citropa]